MQIFLSKCYQSLLHPCPEISTLLQEFFEFQAFSRSDILWVEWKTVPNSHVKRYFLRCRISHRTHRDSGGSFPLRRYVDEKFLGSSLFSAMIHCVITEDETRRGSLRMVGSRRMFFIFDRLMRIGTGTSLLWEEIGGWDPISSLGFLKDGIGDKWRPPPFPSLPWERGWGSMGIPRSSPLHGNGVKQLKDLWWLPLTSSPSLDGVINASSAPMDKRIVMLEEYKNGLSIMRSES